MIDRVEKLAVTRTPSGTTVKVQITENGIPVTYAVKSYESKVKGSIAEARAGAEKLLKQVREALEEAA